MVIYGVALLAFSSLLGLVLGDWLGALIGVKANVGGVGFSMILLISLTAWLTKRGWFQPLSASGVVFWSGMYIPIVVAMAAQQNVLAAIKGGPLAFLAGAIGVVLSFALVPLIARIGRPKRPEEK
ncbi:MAG: malonate transporter subunit MadL [Opitutus sp.]|nr:malonate transporter subunit MadL [Opitutus sp.]